MPLRAEFLETGQGIEACSLEFGQGNFPISVDVDFTENSIDDQFSLPLMLFIVLCAINRLARDTGWRTIVATFDFFCEYT